MPNPRARVATCRVRVRELWPRHAASVGFALVTDAAARYLTFDRDEWADLRAATPLTLRESARRLAAVRRASVGVYQRTGRAGEWSREKLLSHTDKVMRNRGWSRLVGVTEHGQAVLVYASDEIDSSNRLELCVAVVDDDNLVVVSTRVDAEAVAKLAETKMPAGGWRTKLAKI